MHARFVYKDMLVEWQDAQYRLQAGSVYDLYHDGSMAVIQENGNIVIVDADKLRSAVYHPEGTGKPINKSHYPRHRNRMGPFACATCRTALTPENATKSQLRYGGCCRICVGVRNKRRNRKDGK